MKLQNDPEVSDSTLSSRPVRQGEDEMIRVWQVDEVNWYAAETLEEARQAYRDDIGSDAANECMSDCAEPEPVTEEEMLKYKMCHIDEPGHPIVTFAEALKEMIDNGIKFPAAFASTEY